MRQTSNLILFIAVSLSSIISSCTILKESRTLEVKRIDTYYGNPRIYSTSLIPINNYDYYSAGFYTGFIKSMKDSISTSGHNYNGFVFKKVNKDVTLLNVDREILEMKSFGKDLYLNSRGQGGTDLFVKVNRNLNIIWQRKFKSRWPDVTTFDVNKHKSLYLFNYSDSLILDNGQKFYYPFGEGKTSTIVQYSKAGKIEKAITRNIDRQAFAKIILCSDNSYYLIHRSSSTIVYRYSSENIMTWQVKIDGWFADAILEKGNNIKLITVNSYYNNAKKAIDVVAMRLNKDGRIIYKSQVSNLEPTEYENIKIQNDGRSFMFTCNSSIENGGSTNDFTRHTYSIKLVSIEKKGKFNTQTINLINVSSSYFVGLYRKTIFLTVEFFDSASINDTDLPTNKESKNISACVAILKNK